MEKKEGKDLTTLEVTFVELFGEIKEENRKLYHHFIKKADNAYDSVIELWLKKKNRRERGDSLYFEEAIADCFSEAFGYKRLVLAPGQGRSLPDLPHLQEKDRAGILGHCFGTYLATVDYCVTSPLYKEWLMEYKRRATAKYRFNLRKIIETNKEIIGYLTNAGIDIRKLKSIKKRLEKIADNEDLCKEQKDMILHLARYFG